MHLSKVFFAVLTVLSTIFFLSCSESTTPSHKHFSFSYYFTRDLPSGSPSVDWNAQQTSFQAMPQADSAEIGGYQNTSGSSHESFIITFCRVHEGTYHFGSDSLITITGDYTVPSLSTTYKMLPGGKVTISSFKNTSAVEDEESKGQYHGTFSGTMVGLLGNGYPDTIVITNGVFQIPD